MLTGSCHCGAVRIEVPRRPRSLTSCNCSICRRYGALWAYYKASGVKIRGPIDHYVWGDRTLGFGRCRTCGCVTHWESIKPMDSGKMGVNARNFDPQALEGIPIRLLDGAASWKVIKQESMTGVVPKRRKRR
jgi:hypothetical protein